MKSMLHFLTLAAVAALALAACGDPCRDLSERVCRCKSTIDQQRACLAQVSSLASQRQADTDKKHEQNGTNACIAALRTCDCAALAQGNLKACALSIE